MSAEYSPVYLGECGAGSCDRPATLRVFEDFVLCALHYAHYTVGEEIDEAGLSLELIGPWRSHAKMHGCDHLEAWLDRTEGDLKDRLADAQRRVAGLEAVECENVGDDSLRLRMGAAARAEESRERGDAAAEEPSDVRSVVNGLLTRASDLLEESAPMSEDEAQSEVDARHKIAEAGLILSRLGRRRDG